MVASKIKDPRKGNIRNSRHDEHLYNSDWTMADAHRWPNGEPWGDPRVVTRMNQDDVRRWAMMKILGMV